MFFRVFLFFKSHDFLKEKDARRDAILDSFGIKVLKIKNEELQNINNVLIKIRNAFNL